MSISIRENFKSYCQSCPNLVVETEHNTINHSNGEAYHHITIECERRLQCKSLLLYLERKHGESS